MKFIDKATGQDVDIPDAQAHQAYLSGQYGLHAGQTYALRAPDGSMGTFDAQQVQGALQQGATFANLDEFHQAQLQAKHGGLGSLAAAAAEGVGRGITMGASDPLAVGAARAFGGDEAAEAVRTHLEEEKEAHPWAAGAGEALGAIAPIALSGGTAAPEEAAGVLGKMATGIRSIGVLPRAVSGAGDVAESMVSGVLGRSADTVLGRAAQSAAKGTARAIVEGGIFGGAQGADESYVKNKPLLAENIIASAGHGALYAGLLGGGLGGFGKLAAEGGSAVLGKIAPKLDEAAGEQAFKWLAPKNSVTKEAIARGGGTDAVGRTLMDEVMRPAIEQDGIAALRMDPEEKVAAVRSALDRVGKKIGDTVEGYPEASVKLGDMVDPIDSRIGEFSGKVGGEDKVAALQKLRNSVLDVFGVGIDKEGIQAEAKLAAMDRGLTPGTDEYRQAIDEHMTQAASDAYLDKMDTAIPLKQVMTQRRALQQIAYEETRALDPKLRVQMLRQVSGAWGELEQDALNSASKEMGEAAGDNLKALNKTYQQLKIAEDAAESTQASYATNRNFSMSDYLSGIGPGMVAALAGHPVGAIGGVATALLHRELRHHANAYAAIALDRLSTWGGISRAVSDVEAQTDRAIDASLSARRIKMGRAFHTSSESRYEQERDRVTQMTSMAEAVAAPHLERQTAALATHAPETAQLVQQGAKDTTAFLASKVPPQLPSNPAMPHLGDKPVSPEDRARFLRYVDASEGRMPYVLQKLAAGRLSPEDMETATKLFPAALTDARAKMSVKLGARKKPLEYQRALQMSVFMGQPMDQTLEQPFIQGMQELLAKTAQQPKPPAPGGGRGRAQGGGKTMDRVAKSLQTPTEAAMGGT